MIKKTIVGTDNKGNKKAPLNSFKSDIWPNPINSVKLRKVQILITWGDDYSPPCEVLEAAIVKPDFVSPIVHTRSARLVTQADN